MTVSGGIQDRYGLPITTSSARAVEEWVEGLDLLISYNYGQDDRFQRAIEADEGFALAYAALALSLMVQGRLAEAKERIELAGALSTTVSAREGRQVEAVGLLVDGRGRQSLAMLKEHLAEYPRDMLMLRLSQALYAVGCSGAGVPNYPYDLRALLQSVEAAYGDDWAFLGQYAFAHHETGALEEAGRLAERSLTIRPTNAWAAHSVAHVYFEKGDHSGGTGFLGNWLPGFDRRAPFHVHLSWHWALAELAMGRYQRVTEIYQQDIWPAVLAKRAAALGDSASLLWRCQMYTGVTPPIPWEEVRELGAPAAKGPGPASRDAHAAIAFAASGDRAAQGRLVARLESLARGGDKLAEEITLPLVRAVGSFATGDYQETVKLLEPISGQFVRIGLSHAQREVFEDTLLEAHLRAEQFNKAESLLKARLGRRASARDMFWLARAQAGNGQPKEAQKNLGAASDRWEGADHDSIEFEALRRLVATVD